MNVTELHAQLDLLIGKGRGGDVVYLRLVGDDEAQSVSDRANWLLVDVAPCDEPGEAFTVLGAEKEPW